jgi:predicted MFS family arabinose efflux permease
MEMLCAGAFTVIAGYIIDKRGWRTTFFTGLVLYGAGTILSGLAPHVLVFVLARGIAGAGFGFTTMAIRGYVNTSANEKVRSEGVSAFITGLFAGLNCGVIVGAMLADRVGFTTVFYISFGLLAVGGLFALAFMRGASIKQSVQTAASAAKGGILSFFGNREVLVFFLCILVPTAISGMFLDYFFPVFAESIGISSSNIGRAFLVNGLVVVYFGPLLSKWCSKYLNVKQSLVLAAVTVISSLLFFATQGTVAAAFVVVILLGVADSFGLVAQNNYFVQLEATGRIGRGKAFGYYGNVKKLGQMLGPVVFGGVAGLGYIGVGLVGAVFLASLTLFMISARSKRRNDINRQNGLNI